MAATCDVIVLGLGGIGSATAYHLARRGMKVIGIDQFDPPHALGSSTGETRVIREAYFEHPSYVPLVQRAYQLWEELEQLSGSQLYLKTGGMMIGRPDSVLIEGSQRSAREHQLPFEMLSAEELSKRCPAFVPPQDFVGFYEPRAGIVFPERCIAAHLQQAKAAGAELHPNEPVIEWRAENGSVKVTTERGVYSAAQVVICAGPWIAKVVRDLPVHFVVQRQVLLWFEAVQPALFTPDRFPVYLWEYEPEKFFYGFPDLGSGVKIALHGQGITTTPEKIDRDVRVCDIDSLRTLMAKYFPAANGRFLRGTVCMYTNTPDCHFFLDFHPAHRNVIIASPCSGHGFKFASAVGENLAALAQHGRPRMNLSFFSGNRFETRVDVAKDGE